MLSSFPSAGALLAAFIPTAGPQARERTIVVDIREPQTVRNATGIVEGTCDNQPVSVAITKAFHGAPGGIVLRYGRRSREIPATFADGLLVRNTAYSAALTCDGRRIAFIVHVLRMNGAPVTGYYSQSATLDLRSGALSLSELRQESAEEFGAHVQ